MFWKQASSLAPTSWLLSARHAADVVNEILLLLGPAILLWVAAGRIRGEWSGPWRTVFWALPGALFLLLVKRPALGAPFDWDMFTPVFLPATLLAVEHWRRNVRARSGDESRRVLLVSCGRVATWCTVVAGAWLAVNLDAERSARRVEALAGRAPYSNVAAHGFEVLAGYYYERDLAKARDMLALATARSPFVPRNFANLGRAEMLLERYEPARAALERALFLGLRRWQVLHDLGVCAVELDRPADAVKSFDAALQLEPNRWESFASRGAARLNLEQVEPALADLQHAKALAPREASVRYYEAVALARLERFTEARAAAAEALHLSPDHAGAAALLANIDRRTPAPDSIGGGASSR
jgi:hypothetical protein